jgi:hypothetical protein
MLYTMIDAQLVLNIVWPWIFFRLQRGSRLGVQGDPPFAARQSGADRGVLSAVQVRRLVDGALSGLDQYRLRLEFHELADERQLKSLSSLPRRLPIIRIPKMHDCPIQSAGLHWGSELFLRLSQTPSSFGKSPVKWPT